MPPTSPTTVPTSFVPKQPVKTGGKFAQSGQNLVLIGAVMIFGLSLLGAAGMFGFEYYLKSIRDAKAAEVAKTQAATDSAMIEEFVRTRDRFIAAQEVLDRHVTASQFFDLLDRVTLKTVRFSTLSLEVADDRTAKISVEGIARSFNALAAQSSLLAEEKDVQRAIFSDISVNTDNTVSFTLDAALDESLLTLTSAEVTLPEVPVATTTPATASSTPQTATSTAPTP